MQFIWRDNQAVVKWCDTSKDGVLWEDRRVGRGQVSLHDVFLEELMPRLTTQVSAVNTPAKTSKGYNRC